MASLGSGDRALAGGTPTREDAVSLIDWALVTALIVTYLILLTVLGLTTLFKGRILLFVLGLALPLLWIVGAMMNPKLRDDEQWLEARDLSDPGET